MLNYLALVVVFSFLFASRAAAIYDPLSVDNNRVGVHILSPDEIGTAAKLVNNNGRGSWGYVTVPIQATDRDRPKWISFMTKAAELKIIPIIRVATIVDGSHWLKPNDNDLIDFANFLDDLPWPTQNRYVAIFNEVNRPDEFGGTVSPEDYADILSNALDIFKQRSDKFFILPSALDNAAPNQDGFIRYDVYLARMQARQPEIFNKIDGWNSHAYGNPGFAVSPALSGSNKADSFKSDLALLNRYSQKKLPVFVTEAGWSNKSLDDRTIATFFNHAFSNSWNDSRVVVITPFLLFAGSEPFSQFSLLDRDHQPTLAYRAIQAFVNNGRPLLEDRPTPTPTATISPPMAESDAPAGAVLAGQASDPPLGLWQRLVNFFAGLFPISRFNKSLSVGDKNYRVEVVSSDRDLAIGLSKYDRLGSRQGMLFRLPATYIPTFWMKNMAFDIDLVWISAGAVIDVSQGYAAEPLKLLSPKEAVDSVLEVNLNSGIKPGDQVKIN